MPGLMAGGIMAGGIPGLITLGPLPIPPPMKAGADEFACGGWTGLGGPPTLAVLYFAL